ncbi:MAG TPA: hypothetical protein VGF41_09280, partial [Myxococcaceae bacterium]
MNAFRKPVRRAAQGLPLVLALVLAASAAGQNVSNTPLLSTDGGAVTATSTAPDTTRPVARRINFRDAVA